MDHERTKIRESLDTQEYSLMSTLWPVRHSHEEIEVPKKPLAARIPIPSKARRATKSMRHRYGNRGTEMSSENSHRLGSSPRAPEVAVVREHGTL